MKRHYIRCTFLDTDGDTSWKFLTLPNKPEVEFMTTNYDLACDIANALQEQDETQTYDIWTV